MPRLPKPGGDQGTWGDILNQYLLVEHKADGTLKNVLRPELLAKPEGIATLGTDGLVLPDQLPAAVAPPDADADTKGMVRLSGDLGGTAESPLIANDAITTAKVADGTITDVKVAVTAAIAQSKIANLTTDMSAKALKATIITAGTGLSGGGDLSANRTLNVDNDTTTQKVEIARGGTLTGTRKRLNFIQGSNTTLTVADDAINNKVDITIAAAGVADATTISKGIVQLAGDLTGTAAAPTIASSAVTTGKLNDYAVTSIKIADNGVTTGKLPDEAVTTPKLADGSIIDSKVDIAANIAQSKIANLTSDLSSKVSKAGDSMSGNLVISKATPKIQMADSVLTGGLTTEVSGQLFDYGVNYSQLNTVNTSYMGAFFRIDTRDTYADQMFNIKYIPAGSTTESTPLKLSRTGTLAITGGLSVAGKIVNVTNPTDAQDAATKNYVDTSISTAGATYVIKTGDTMSGALNVNASGTGVSLTTGTDVANSATGGSGIIHRTSSDALLAGHRLGFTLYGGPSTNAAGIAAYADSTWNSTNKAAYFTFETVAPGATTREERVRIAANGNVGIGVAPSARLHVTESTDALVTQVNAARALTGTASVIDVYNSGVLRTRLRAYGIQEWYLNSGSAEVGSITYSTPGGNPAVLIQGTSSTNRGTMKLVGSSLILGASSTGVFPDHFTILASGNVGIGTTDPGDKLDVAGNIVTSGAANRRLELNAGANTASTFDINILGPTTAAATVRMHRLTNTTGRVAFDINQGNNTTAVNTSLAGNGSSYLNALVGNVGIGITNPGASLHVNSLAVSGGQEQIFKMSVADAADYVVLINNTSTDANFDPAFRGYTPRATGTPLSFIGGVEATQDTGTVPLVSFQARRGELGGSTVVNRPLFGFNNYATRVMTILANGNVGINVTNPGAQFQVDASSATTVGQIVKAAASQTADLQQWQNSAGTTLARVDVAGSLIAATIRTNSGTLNAIGGGAIADAMLAVHSGYGSAIPVVIRGFASQTADLQQWQNSTGTVLAKIDGPNGHYGGPGATYTAPSAGYIPMIVKAAASQTADLQQWQDSAGNVLTSIGGSNGAVRTNYVHDRNGTRPYINLEFSSNSIATVSRGATQVPWIIRGAASQTADLQQWQDSTGTVIAKITATGAFSTADPTNAQDAATKNYVDTTFVPLSEKVATSAATGTTYTIAIANGTIHDITLTANCTLTFPAAPAAGRASTFTLLLRQDATGNRTVTWPAGIIWASGVEPALTTTASKLDVLTFMYVGSAWLGFVSATGMG